MYHYSFLIKEVRQTISLNKRHVALSLKEETHPKDFNKPKNGRGEWYNFLILNDEIVVKIKKEQKFSKPLLIYFFANHLNLKCCLNYHGEKIRLLIKCYINLNGMQVYQINTVPFVFLKPPVYTWILK